MSSQRFSRAAVAQRKSPREAKNHIVTLEFDDGSPAISGMLSDISATGARLSVPGANLMPAYFVVVFAPTLRRRCRLVWQSTTSMGVAFVIQ